MRSLSVMLRVISCRWVLILLVAAGAIGMPGMIAGLTHNLGALIATHVLAQTQELVKSDHSDQSHRIHLAESYLAPSAGKTPYQLSADRLLAAIYLSQGQAEVAELRARQALADAPADPIAGFWLGQSLMRTGRHDDAISAWRAAGAATYFVHEANLHHWVGDDVAALDAYRIAGAVDPQAPPTELRVAMAWAYYGQGDKKASETELIGAVDHAATKDTSDKYALALGSLGIFYSRESRWAEAADWLLQALSITPEDLNLRVWLGGGYSQMGLLELAEKELLKALKAPDKETRGYAYVNLGNTYRQSNQWEKALSAYATAAALFPESIDYQWYLAKGYFDAGHISDAQRICRRIVVSTPESAERTTCETILAQKVH